MGASACLSGPLTTTRKAPLVLRYLLHAHKGGADPDRATRTAQEFAALKPFEVVKAQVKHVQFTARRVTSG
jgi:hypothetical protein